MLFSSRAKLRCSVKPALMLFSSRLSATKLWSRFTLRAVSTAEAAAAVRLKIRNGDHHGPTMGLAPGAVQGNLVILPKQYAEAFRLYCEQNPQPCPLLATSEPGSPELPSLGADIDIRTDVPKYRVYRDGVFREEVEDIRQLWQEDFVVFVLGCSFSFEQALLESDLRLRYVDRGRNVAMYVTNIETRPSEPFHGKMCVSMRDFQASGGEVRKAVEVTSRFPKVHGTPIHAGDCSVIGIQDIEKPDYGDAPQVEQGSDRVPVFWACGVTPQVAIENAKVPLVITHAPGHMLITDLENSALETIVTPDVHSSTRASSAPALSPSVFEEIGEILLEHDMRGMTALVEQGHVARSASVKAADLALSQPAGVCLIATGFYIRKAGATETDGPPGAVVLGNALAGVGFTPVYVTDEFSRHVVSACAGPEARVIVFPITTDDLSREFAKGLLEGLQPTLLCAVERGGKGKDGCYRNMLGEDFSDYNAKIDALFEIAEGVLPSIGIADGGNEIGCGALAASGAIPGADPARLVSPPCFTRTTELVVSSCSNWGAYGVAAALALRTARPELLPSPSLGWDLVKVAVEAGAVDGVLHTPGLLSVDGRGEEENSACLQRLHTLLSRHLSA